MKIIYQVLLGILVATSLSFVIVSFGTVQPVLKQPTMITPVPTPQVVYVTVQPTPQENVPQSSEPYTPPTSQEDLDIQKETLDVVYLLPILMILGIIGLMAIVVARLL